ncbi:MAG: CDP-diacylglycerol--glycerol-3-phosphate 3-phosphatidyltransferase [Caldicoprobacterales bacterium]|jgi:CDP-diacylglycerol--glycerol-3-phosphate 3-phosphatidyltransferase|nr:CDP-diacylglycerol--glycerol-3-phosphate 3-phosphatidyltransferase [Clostridiales bacterium]
MNLANKITILRILFIPLFVAILLIPFPYHNFAAAFVFLIAASTDSLDGYIARKRNEITNFGKFIDPLADKLLVCSALICLVEMASVPAIAAIIIISREFIITGFRLLAVTEGSVIAASWWGKLKTVTQIVALTSLLLDNFPFYYIGIPFDQIALYLSVTITIVSGVDYILKNKGLLSLENGKLK